MGLVRVQDNCGDRQNADAIFFWRCNDSWEWNSDQTPFKRGKDNERNSITAVRQYSENVNQGAAYSEHHQALNCMRSSKSVKMLLNVVATIHFAYKTLIFVNSFTIARRCPPISALASHTANLTFKKRSYMYWLNNCEMRVAWPSTIAFCIHSFMHCLVTLFFTQPKMMSVIKKPMVKTRLLVSSKVHFRYGCTILHPCPTV